MVGQVVLVSVGDVAVAFVATLFALYEAWLWRLSRRGPAATRWEHLWVCLCCAGAAVFSAGMAVQYNTTAEIALWVTRIESVALVVTVHAMAAFAITVTGREPRGARWFLPLNTLVWTVLSLTPLLIPAVELRQVLGVPQPFIRRVDSVGGTIGSISAIAMALWASYWLLRHRGSRADARWFSVAVAGWALAGAHDAAQSLLFRQPVMRPPLLEYGFFLFAGTLVARHLVAHQRMLERSRRDFRALVERTPDAVAVVRDGVVSWCNDAAAQLVGCAPERLVGRRYDELVEGDVRRELKPSLLGQGAIGPVEARLRRDDGTHAELEIVAVVMDFDLGPATVVMARDVSTRRQLVARLVEMDRMITAGTLSAGVGHEINNPLAYALLNLREALRTTEQPRVQELLAASEEGMERIEGVVRALRSFATIDDQTEVVTLESVVRSAVAIAGNEVRLRAALELDLEPGLCVAGGQTRIGQVVTNLLVNAAQAIEEGAPEDNRVTVRTFGQGDQVVLEVSDTGAGIPDWRLDRIFDPFFTTKAPDVGTGLGLTICREKVEELGGTLEVSSVVGEGTTFVARLARAERIEEEEAEGSPVSRRSDPETLGVLLVDDEVALVSALRRALRRHARVLVARSGQEALDLLADGAEVDVVLTDLMMPGMSGMKLFDEIERRWPRLAARMLFMSGGAFTSESRAFCEKMGARVLAKPIDIDDLVARLQSRRSRRDEGGSAQVS